MTHSAISDAADAVSRVRTALLSCSLEELEQAIPALTESARHLRSLEKRLGSAPLALNSAGRGAILQDLAALKRGLESATRLVQSGEALQQGWIRLLGAAAGYTASGGAASLTSSLASVTRVSVTG